MLNSITQIAILIIIGFFFFGDTKKKIGEMKSFIKKIKEEFLKKGD